MLTSLSVSCCSSLFLWNAAVIVIQVILAQFLVQQHRATTCASMDSCIVSTKYLCTNSTIPEIHCTCLPMFGAYHIIHMHSSNNHHFVPASCLFDHVISAGTQWCPCHNLWPHDCLSLFTINRAWEGVSMQGNDACTWCWLVPSWPGIQNKNKLRMMRSAGYCFLLPSSTLVRAWLPRFCRVLSALAFVFFSGVYLMRHAKLAIGIRRVAGERDWWRCRLSCEHHHILFTLFAKQPCCCTRTKSPLLCLCPLPYCRVWLWLLVTTTV